MKYCYSNFLSHIINSVSTASSLVALHFVGHWEPHGLVSVAEATVSTLCSNQGGPPEH